MNFFEKELRKIISPIDPKATYTGRTCYMRLGGGTHARVDFATGGIADQYDRLRILVLNRHEGEVDRQILRFDDVWGQKMKENPCLSDGVCPHIWIYQNKPEWYSWQPRAADYTTLSHAVREYTDLFREQAQEPQWEQTM